jgi:hypothetical protein
MFTSKNFNPNAGSNVPKILSPGTHLCRIVDLKLEAPPYKTDSYFLVLTLEGVNRGTEFTGIAKDKNNPAAGNYEGQIANVRSGRYSFSDYVYNGKEVKRDNQIFKWINTLAKQLGVLDAMNASNASGDTIEDYVNAVKKFITNPELWAHHTIAGQEYYTAGYDKPNYRMFYPKQEQSLFPVSALEDQNGNPVNLISFDAAKHILVKEETPSQPVDSFGGQVSQDVGFNATDMLNTGNVTGSMPDINLPF